MNTKSHSKKSMLSLSTIMVLLHVDDLWLAPSCAPSKEVFAEIGVCMYLLDLKWMLGSKFWVLFIELVLYPVGTLRFWNTQSRHFSHGSEIPEVIVVWIFLSQSPILLPLSPPMPSNHAPATPTTANQQSPPMWPGHTRCPIARRHDQQEGEEQRRQEWGQWAVMPIPKNCMIF